MLTMLTLYFIEDPNLIVFIWTVFYDIVILAMLNDR